MKTVLAAAFALAIAGTTLPAAAQDAMTGSEVCAMRSSSGQSVKEQLAILMAS